MTPTEAALALELARQNIRVLRDIGKEATDMDRQRVADAEKQLDAARAQVGGGVR